MNKVPFTKERTKTVSVYQEPALRIPEVAAFSNIGKREEQQDAYWIPTSAEVDEYPVKGIYAALADGMGGMKNGDEASNIAIEVGVEYFRSVGIQEKPHQSLLQIAAQSNKNVVEYVNYEDEVGGTTFIAVFIREGKLWFVSLGDSRIYLYRAGKLLMLNREHIYARTLDVESADGLIRWEDADNDPQRDALTDFIGKKDKRAYDFNIRPVKLLRGDGILIMSDGVFNTLTEEEIEAEIARKRAKAGMTHLQQAVLEKQKLSQDNFTCVYIKF